MRTAMGQAELLIFTQGMSSVCPVLPLVYLSLNLQWLSYEPFLTDDHETFPFHVKCFPFGVVFVLGSNLLDLFDSGVSHCIDVVCYRDDVAC